MSTLLLFSDKTKYETTANKKDSKDNLLLPKKSKTNHNTNKKIPSPPSHHSLPSPQFYYYNHSDSTCLPMSPPPSATFQQPIKTTAHKRKRSYHKQERRYSCPSFDNLTKKKGLNGLEDEFAYTQENLATVNIMFDSLKQAFIDCEPQLKPNITRLDDMEKELLSAYDDLELQVIHLERHINKLESSWQQWKSSQNLEQQFPSPSTSTSSLS